MAPFSVNLENKIVFAETKDIIISADKYFVELNDTIKITAKGVGITLNVESTFRGYVPATAGVVADPITFSDKSCDPLHCFATFKAQTEGTYTIQVLSQEIDKIIYKSPILSVIATKNPDATNDFKIFADKQLVKSGEVVSVTAIMFSKEKPSEFNFSSSPPVKGFNDTAKCNPTEEKNIGKENLWSCTVQFQSSVKKLTSYSIKASTGSKESNIVSIDVGEGVLSVDDRSENVTVPSSDYFDCSWEPWSDWACKIGEILYVALFVPMATFTWLAAKILDFFVYYSTNSSSYSGEFVNKAWAAVRDIANIFFIIALLYVAIKTILGLNVTDNKKLVGAVIIVALVINFSLFTTKVVIDSSNILAKIFYNNITSETKSTDETVKESEVGKGGQKSISVGLVQKFDPQSIITAEKFKNQEGLFIFVTILAILLMGFMIYIFLSVAILFVSRVVSLWISMIFSPLAFVSYTVPFEIPGFGHKKWWDDLLKNAFLAPVFIFFLYIIILFGDAMKSIPGDVLSTTSGIEGFLDAAMKVIIPFAIIFMLLLKAKKIAIEFSGEMGAAIMKGAQMIGGVALGAATGGMAIAGRATIGRASVAAANSGWAKKWEAKGYGGGMAKKLFEVGGKGSFDVRGIKVAGKDLAGVTGMTTMGKPKEGGFEKTRKDKVEKRQKRAEGLKVGEDEKLTQTVNKAEIDLQGLLNQTAKEFERIDKELVAARQKKADNANSPAGSAGEAAHNAAIAEIDALKTRKTDIREGRAVAAAGGGAAIGPIAVVGGPNDRKTIKQMENNVIPDAKNAKLTESRRRTTNYANTIQGNKFTRIIGTRGGKANREAQHKIIMESKLDSGTKT